MPACATASNPDGSGSLARGRCFATKTGHDALVVPGPVPALTPMLWQRVLTALVLAPAVLALIFLAPPLAVTAAFAAITLLAGWEWAHLARLETPVRRAPAMAVLALALAAWWYLPAWHGPWLGLALLWWFAAGVAVLFYPRGAARWNQPPLVLASGLIVLPTTFGALAAIHATHGPWSLLLLLFVVWAADIGAYFAGRAFGRRKLAPQVSPGKSWEGAAGGLVTALAIGMGTIEASAFTHFGALPLAAAVLVLIVVISIFGDLVESMLKRACGVKDSGGLLPGHGGVLDRIDSLLSTAVPWALLTGALSLAAPAVAAAGGSGG